ncbi:PadR family transcriptional regulator [Microbacterium sp. cx-55]|uniref:PadR family transcriptional regulator n=1 Tax=unclassified Microbacterium TaxID=2609290 RepID=UPI001CC0B3E9|nr:MULTISPECIES: helix-turn-helix transcriptional regulator [unclassified Microbacterium]MBZ4488728.1 PadR family transcriptional regulator [Microbacterium sp. cx-55]MCC4909584.1 PadR family transcriptional regulator [Microbacterium sp. cx-59]UGB36036.1 PadR family transcriptional regulator [Microbacterium sp. cx-55]
MSVRRSLLAILDQGACYGYQLRAEFDRRTGSVWPLNVGQIYNTLERLERDGLVVKGDTDEHGHVYYEITDAGRADARAWFQDTVERPATRDELSVKIALAATLPGVTASRVVAAEETAARGRVTALRANDPSGADDTPDLAALIVHEHLLAQAEAEVVWLGRVAERLAQHPESARTVSLSERRPKRGRPARVA